MSTFFQRVRICIALIERFGIKRVLIAVQETHRSQQSSANSVPPATTFHRYTVFQ